MGVVADRVIVELEAKLDRYEANVLRAEQKFDAATRAIASDAKRLEKSITASSGVIGAQFKGLATAFAAAFSAQQVASLTDSYTRFTNQLKVAGLEGEGLAKVQEQIFAIAQKNGTPLESLANLYQRSSSAAKDLGASQADLRVMIEGVSAGLRVQGAGTAQADQAILGFVQALGTGIVKAEEFNQVNDAAPVLLQAVAKNIDAAGGSVARLRQLVVNQKVTSAEFFQAFLKGSADLQAQSTRTNLTIAGSFQILTNALTVFIGQATQANGVTAAVSGGLTLLAENLDTVANAIAVLAAVLLGRFVSGLVAAGAASGVTSAAIFAMQARAIGAATTMEGLAFTSATAGRAMLAAFGGPVGLAVTALTIGIGYLASESAAADAAAAELTGSIAEQAKQFGLAAGHARQANAETNNLTSVERAALTATANLTGEANKLAEAWARVAAAAKSAAIEQAQAVLDKARSNRIAADQALEADKSRGTFFGFRLSSAGADPKPELVNQSDLASRNERAAQQTLDEIRRRQLAKFKPEAPSVAAVTGATAKPKKTKGAAEGRKTDPEAAARRFADDLARGDQELAAARAELIGTVEARRDAERARIESERAITARNIAADKDLTAKQREQLLAMNDKIAAERKAVLDAEEREQHFAELIALQQADLATEKDLLNAREALAKSTSERREIALRLLELEKQEEKIRLEAVIASRAATDAEKRIARDRLGKLDAIYGAKQSNVEKNNQGPLADWFAKFDKSPGEIQDQVEGLIADELNSVRDGINSAITNALGIKDPIIGGLLQMLLDQILFKPIAQALEAAQGGGGGGIGGLFTSIIGSISGLFGRASGGHVLGGQMYRVNEGGRGAEGFMPAGSGKIIPLGRMRSASSGVALYQTVNVDARGSVNPDGYAEHIRRAVRKDTLDIVGEGMRRVNQGVPRRMAQFERDGR